MAVHVSVPRWTCTVPVLLAALLALKALHLMDKNSATLLLAAAALIGFNVFAAVDNADQLTARVGEPFGSILLALAITVMEVAVILHGVFLFVQTSNHRH